MEPKKPIRFAAQLKETCKKVKDDLVKDQQKDIEKKFNELMTGYQDLQEVLRTEKPDKDLVTQMNDLVNRMADKIHVSQSEANLRSLLNKGITEIETEFKKHVALETNLQPVIDGMVKMFKDKLQPDTLRKDFEPIINKAITQLEKNLFQLRVKNGMSDQLREMQYLDTYDRFRTLLADFIDPESEERKMERMKSAIQLILNKNESLLKEVGQQDYTKTLKIRTHGLLHQTRSRRYHLQRRSKRNDPIQQCLSRRPRNYASNNSRANSRPRRTNESSFDYIIKKNLDELSAKRSDLLKQYKEQSDKIEAFKNYPRRTNATRLELGQGTHRPNGKGSAQVRRGSRQD